jgi:hypothetical protein
MGPGLEEKKIRLRPCARHDWLDSLASANPPSPLQHQQLHHYQHQSLQ